MAKTLSDIDGLRDTRRGFDTWYARTDLRLSSGEAENSGLCEALHQAIVNTEEFQSGAVIIVIDGEGHVRTFNLGEGQIPS